jgi:Xaa-Pro aminopeptidase
MKELSVNQDHAKLHKVIALLKQKDLVGLIIYSGGTCSILRPSYLYYFSEFKPMGLRNAAVISKSGDIGLLVEPKWDEVRASRKSWIRDVRGTSDFLDDLLKTMRQYKIKGPVGVVGSKEMTSDIYLGIEKQAELVLADDIVEEIAREKTPRELEIVRATSGIADIGFNAFLEKARVGIREYELAAEMEFAMRCAGADDIFILLSSGKHNFEMHEPRDRRLEKGDVLIGEITPVLEGQFIQLCRTVVLGEPTPLLRQEYEILVRALEETLLEVKAGVSATVIAKAMNRVISEAGYAKYCYPPHMRARGHGFGAGSIAPGGAIDEDTRANLERDQVVVIHPNQYLPEVGYLACGETYLITDTGVEGLSETETRLYVKEG